MQRWVCVRDGIVRCYILSPAEPNTAAKRLAVFGVEAADGPLRDLAAEGAWRLAPDSAGLVGDGYSWNGTAFAPPVAVVSRIITGAAFLELLLAAEYALIVSTPTGAMAVARLAAGGSQINLDSPRIVTVFNLAVTANQITRVRADRVLSGLPPL